MLYEVPPTAGLPLEWSDLIPSDRKLESCLADIIGAKGVTADDIIVSSSATALLLAALHATKKRNGCDEVIVAGYTCPLVALAIEQAGLKTIACDLKPNSFDLDLSELQRLLNRNTLCIIATHMGGLPCDIEAIAQIARDYGVFLIEDAAQALGARVNGRSVGTFGDIGVFSLTRGKGLSIYEGGFLIAKDHITLHDVKDLVEKMEIRNKGGSLDELLKVSQLLGLAMLYNPVGMSFVYGMPLRNALKANNIVKAVGDDLAGPIKINRVCGYRKSVGANAAKRFNSFLKNNQERARRRIERIKRIEGFSVIEEQSSASGSWPFISVVCTSNSLRDKVLERLWTSGLGVTRLFACELTGYDYLKNDVAESRHLLRHSRNFAERSFMISNSHWLTDDGFDSVITVLEQVISTSKITVA